MSDRPTIPSTRRQDVIDVLHGVSVHDPYRWLESADSDEVKAWDEAHRAAFKRHAGELPQARWLRRRLTSLWRYDDETTPAPCLLSDRQFVQRRRADQDKWAPYFRDGDDGELRLVLDPNTWDAHDTLDGFFPSPDGRYVAYGRAHAGDENPVLRVLDLQTMVHLDDRVTGWRQGGVVWKHDNSGFFFTGRPAPRTVDEGDEFYYHRVWFHRLSTAAERDELVLFDDEVRERFHGVSLSEDGRWLILGRYRFNSCQLWIAPVDDPSDRRVLSDTFDAEYVAQVIGDLVLIRTDQSAPNARLMVTTVDRPGQESWRELVPESDGPLISVRAVGGALYLNYQDKACTRVAVYSIDGEHLQDVRWPGLGAASVWGFWSRPAVWASYESFVHPREVYRYDRSENALTLLRASPMDIDVSDLQVEQVWYPSADGTMVSMFLVHAKDAPTDGSVPYLLTGYGGFNISRTPSFSSLYALWAKRGGGVAVTNLRGGGEYGRAWHQAGMGENKQNVFDDFIAAAEHLVSEGHTASERLAIAGGSNGGLLVSAVMTQRPELFAAVLCAVPLTDMVRFPEFGIASIWTEEYGDPKVASSFSVLHAYSPYHNAVEGVEYPALLVTGSLNDARTDPVHARKFYAAVHHAASDDRGRWLHVQAASGHHGAVTIDERAQQASLHYGFLMAETGLQAPPNVGDAER